MSISKTFGMVTVSEIKAVKSPNPDKAAGMVVVFTQSRATDYVGSGQDAVQAAYGATPGTSKKTYEGLRKCSSFWTLEALASCNEGNGLQVGDEADGIAISSLSSSTPFYAGQAAYAVTGLFYSPAIEASEGHQPHDRKVVVSEDGAFTITEFGVLAALELTQARIAAGVDADGVVL